MAFGQLDGWILIQLDDFLETLDRQDVKIKKYFNFVEEFPMTVTGKIMKFKMREISIKELGLDD